MDLKLGIASNFLGNNGFIAVSLDDGTSYSIPHSMFAAVSPKLLPSQDPNSQAPPMIQPMHYPNVSKLTFDCVIQWICTGQLPAELHSPKEDLALIALIHIHNFAVTYSITKLDAQTTLLATRRMEETAVSPQIVLAALSNYKPSDVAGKRLESTCTHLQETIMQNSVDDFLQQDLDSAALDELARVPGFLDLFLTVMIKYYNVTRKEGNIASTQ